MTTAPQRPRLTGGRLWRALDPGVPPPVRTLQFGALLNALGNGLVLPFTIIYLHNVRGLSLATAGLVVGVGSGVGLVATPVAGVIVDRIGGRATLAAALVLLAAGAAGYLFVEEPWHAFVASVTLGVGNGLFWPSQSSLIAGLTPPEGRAAAFAMQRVVMNLGVGLGAMAGGFIATTSDPRTFELLFAGDAATFLAYGLVLGRVPSPPPVPHGDEPPGGYLAVLRHRAFLGVIGLNVALITAGIAMFEVLPAYVKLHAGVTETGIGVVFFVNTVLIVALQMPLARAMAGHRRMVALALVGLLWAVAWLLVPVIADSSHGVTATVLLAAVLCVFAVGECFHGAVQAPLVSDLAEPRLIGRYMALSALSWTLGFAIGPALAGVLLDVSPTSLWIGAAAVLALTAVAALALEGSLPPAVRTSPRRA